jgi:hypothetical protein
MLAIVGRLWYNLWALGILPFLIIIIIPEEVIKI